MKNNFIKSPLNYMGGKYKLLPQITPLFPEEIDTFYDLFCGGLDVGVNAKANKVIANDICKPLVEIYKGIQESGAEESLNLVKKEIDTYKLGKFSKEEYKKIREDYNNGRKDWYVFFTMVTHSFNSQVRFNKKGEFNTSSGSGKEDFNSNKENNFIKFAKEIEKKNIEFRSESFELLDIDKLNKKDFVYLDPPYLITDACYMTSFFWTEKEEVKLLEMCDKLNDKNIKFALSNVLERGDKSNDILKEWSKKYTVHYLNHNYEKCSPSKKDRKQKNIEVLITNY